MEGHSDCPMAASNWRSSSLFQTVHCCHSTCNVAWIRAGKSSKDHLRCLPIMWLDILRWSPITFALFTEKYPHDTSSKLSRHKCGPNPPAPVLKEKESKEYSHTVAFLDEITDLNLELGQALRPALRLRSSAWKTLCWGIFRLTWKGAFNPVCSPVTASELTLRWHGNHAARPVVSLHFERESIWCQWELYFQKEARTPEAA